MDHFSKWAVFDLGEASSEEMLEFGEAILIVEGEETVSESLREETGEDPLT